MEFHSIEHNVGMFFCVVSMFSGFAGFGEMQCVCVYHLSLSVHLRGNLNTSCSFSSRWHNPVKHNYYMESSGQRGGIEHFQHCIDITQGQEQRIHKT